MIRFLSLGLELSALGGWLYLMYTAKGGIRNPTDRMPFRCAAAIILVVTVTQIAATITAIDINQKVLITTWAPVLTSVLLIGVAALLGVLFNARSIAAYEPPTWQPEHRFGVVEFTETTPRPPAERSPVPTPRPAKHWEVVSRKPDALHR